MYFVRQSLVQQWPARQIRQMRRYIDRALNEVSSLHRFVLSEDINFGSYQYIEAMTKCLDMITLS